MRTSRMRRTLGLEAQGGLRWSLFCLYTYSNVHVFFQPTSPTRVAAPASFQRSHLHRCLQRGPPRSPNETQRTPQLPANTSVPRHTQGMSPVTTQQAFSFLPRPPSRHTSPPHLRDSTFTPTTSTISTRTLTRFLSRYRCCSIHRAPPPSLLRGQLLSRCTS